MMLQELVMVVMYSSHVTSMSFIVTFSSQCSVAIAPLSAENPLGQSHRQQWSWLSLTHLLGIALL